MGSKESSRREIQELTKLLISNDGASSILMSKSSPSTKLASRPTERSYVLPTDMAAMHLTFD